MCHAYPCPIEKLHPETNEATVNLGGVRKRVQADLLDDPQVGDYVIVHTGFALTQLDQAEAEATLELMAGILADSAPLPLGAGPSRPYAHHQPKFL